MKTPLELACADLVAAERARRSNSTRAAELLAVLERVRRRPHGGLDGLVFFELDELPETGVPEATPHPPIARLRANTEADSASEPLADEWIAP